MPATGSLTNWEAVDPASMPEIEAARKLYASDDVQIDDNARASRPDGDSGLWVSAWVWVPAPCEVDDCMADARICHCGSAHCIEHPHVE